MLMEIFVEIFGWSLTRIQESCCPQNLFSFADYDFTQILRQSKILNSLITLNACFNISSSGSSDGGSLAIGLLLIMTVYAIAAAYFGNSNTDNSISLRCTVANVCVEKQATLIESVLQINFISVLALAVQKRNDNYLGIMVLVYSLFMYRRFVFVRCNIKANTLLTKIVLFIDSYGFIWIKYYLVSSNRVHWNYYGAEVIFNLQLLLGVYALIDYTMLFYNLTGLNYFLHEITTSCDNDKVMEKSFGELSFEELVINYFKKDSEIYKKVAKSHSDGVDNNNSSIIELKTQPQQPPTTTAHHPITSTYHSGVINPLASANNTSNTKESQDSVHISRISIFR